MQLSHEATAAVDYYDQVYRCKQPEKIQTCPDEMVVRIVKSRFPELGVQDVLDAGCGEGRNGLMMAGEGLRVTCLDTSDHALYLLREQSRVYGVSLDFRQASITALPFAEGDFDAIICWRVLYYLTPSEAALAIAEFRRVLRPGGCLYISVPTDSYNFFEIKNGTNDEMILGPNQVYMRRYAEAELTSLLDGFEQIEYGLQAQSFLGAPHRVQSYWHVFGVKPADG